MRFLEKETELNIANVYLCPDDEVHRQVKPSVYAGLQTFIANK